MARPYECDQCEHRQTEPMSFEITQLTDEEDDDGNQVVVQLHLCSTQCLSDFAMGLSLDFPDADT